MKKYGLTPPYFLANPYCKCCSSTIPYTASHNLKTIQLKIYIRAFTLAGDGEDWDSPDWTGNG